MSGDTEDTKELTSPILKTRYYANTHGCSYLVECPKCKKSRWKVKGNFDHTTKTGLCIHCYATQRAEKHSTWRGGRIVSDGYIRIKLQPEDPYFAMADCANYVLEHRLVMAKHLGRCLNIWEVIHHKNGHRNDNNIDNLEIATKGEHDGLTALGRRLRSLEKKVEELLVVTTRQSDMLRLLLWHITELEGINARTS